MSANKHAPLSLLLGTLTTETMLPSHSTVDRLTDSHSIINRLAAGILTASIFMLSNIIATAPAQAASHSSLEQAGDIIAVGIPLIAYGSTYYKDDKEGRQQFYRSFGTTAVTTLTLKSVVNKDRPDNSDDESYPSAHTSVAFQGASFIHKRYGFESSIPAYVGAGFVGYSRLKSDKHDVADVVAGAALGIASSMYLTKSYYSDQLVIAPSLSSDYYGLSVHYHFK
ncbi:phosphatase PAP2 family protein [Psychrobacter sp. DM4]|uniref:phosphatase PAP2 family protein n=1 Tax=Psychrobacter sp. DM4 TaxID=3440637 RepID=UPI003F4FB547